MTTKEEVRAFLADFHQKMKIWEIRVRDDRGKNTQALYNLELSPLQRIKVIEALTVIDYSEGPKTDTLSGGSPLWIFSKKVKDKMIYIKVSVGLPERPVICISFHEAEYEMPLPFKGEQ
ncbi:MAG TPA: hypothetical protein VFE32_12870 [Puia sp.]|jgi:hypothetical protein|nr:hypothetical protein [Puia sp.]